MSSAMISLCVCRLCSANQQRERTSNLSPSVQLWLYSRTSKRSCHGLAVFTFLPCRIAFIHILQRKKILFARLHRFILLNHTRRSPKRTENEKKHEWEWREWNTKIEFLRRTCVRVWWIRMCAMSVCVKSRCRPAYEWFRFSSSEVWRENCNKFNFKILRRV